MAENEREYLHRRATEELHFSDRCSDMIAAQIHRQLAALYAKKLTELNSRDPLEIVEQMATPQSSTSAR